MRTFKKKNIKDFKAVLETKCNECETNEVESIEEEEMIDELVTSTGGSISGDEKNVNNSEIKTGEMPKTTDQFNAMAIQPNRYLYGVMGSAYSVGSRQGTMESVDRIAKDKFTNLLESQMGMNNDSSDSDLPQSVQSKTDIFIAAVENNKLNGNQVLNMLNQVFDAWLPNLDNNQRQMLKDKFNA